MSAHAALPMRLASLAALAGALALAAPAALHAQDDADETGIEWEEGPTTGRLGDVAEIQVPPGYRFTGKEGARRFMELTENPSSGDELGVLIPNTEDESGFFFVVFEFNSIGYVKDDEQNEIDADGILKTIRRGTEAANEERRRRGWSTLEIVGWAQRPFYHAETHNLTWAIRGRETGGESEAINYSTRVLGRRGTMNVDLVMSPEQVETIVPQFGDLMAGFSFTSGNRYAEWREGDPVAAIGLTALIAGGAGAVAMKSGLLAKLWKVIAVGVAAIAGAMRRFFGRLFGRKPDPGAASAS